MRSNLQLRLDGVKYAATDRVLRRYGLVDLFRDQDIAPAGPGVLNKAVAAGKQIGEMGRDLIFGSPVSVAQKLERNYRLTNSVPKALGKYVKDWYLDPNTPIWMRALSVGVPLYGVGSSLLSGPAEKRKENLASGILGMAAAPLTSRLGAVGTDLQAGAQRAAALGSRALESAELPVPDPGAP